MVLIVYQGDPTHLTIICVYYYLYILLFVYTDVASKDTYNLKTKMVIHVILACICMYVSHAERTYEQQRFPSTTIDPEATASVNGKHKCSKLGKII